jgi:glycosyltransferase involved in cell wall biosynthesis
LNRFDTIITLSEIDTHKLQEAGVTTPVLSSFATINRKPETSLESSCGFVLSFVGPEIHSPNKEGILWFLDSCWQRLLKSNPNYELRIIGLWSKETQRQLSDRYQNVHFLGYVDDLAATLKNTIMIVPIQVGSGIRMKILEAGMIGVPVVTTAVGVEGIPLVDGENCFIANTADAFVQSILKLSEQTLREHFIVSAQKVISKNYSLEALIKNREHLYQ